MDVTLLRCSAGRQAILMPDAVSALGNAATLVTPSIRLPVPNFLPVHTDRCSSNGDPSHDHVNRERTEKRTTCHAHATGRVTAGMGSGSPAAALEGKGAHPRP